MVAQQRDEIRIDAEAVAAVFDLLKLATLLSSLHRFYTARQPLCIMQKKLFWAGFAVSVCVAACFRLNIRVAVMHFMQLRA